ncbi:MAG: DUF4302 domain-containing protein [Paludibacter sp.]|nr:DUF4302 domain-containing protein [Paludibacter sp.]
MKTSTYIVNIVVFVLLGLIPACKNEEADIFSASPAERLNKAISDYQNILTNAENGWEMDYFANQMSPGYTLLVKFNKSGSAMLAGRSELTTNGAYEQDSCLFDIIGDNGPVLTFNTFSKILHVFSNPENPDGYGLEGDYEFVIVKAHPDTVWMKGKKYGAEIMLRKLSADVQWKQFADERSEFKTLLFSEKAPALTMKVDRTNYTFSLGYSGVFSVKRTGANAVAFGVPFIVTQDGIRLYEEIEIEEVKFNSFRLNDAKSGLVSVESPEHTLTGVNDLAIFIRDDAETVWDIFPAGLSSTLDQSYKAILQSVQTLYGADSASFSLKYNTIRGSFVLAFSYTVGTTTTEGLLDLNVTAGNKDMLTVSYKGTGDAKGLQFYNDVEGLDDFVSAISSAFALSTAAKINPKEIKFTKATNQQVYFAIKPR